MRRCRARLDQRTAIGWRCAVTTRRRPQVSRKRTAGRASAQTPRSRTAAAGLGGVRSSPVAVRRELGGGRRAGGWPRRRPQADAIVAAVGGGREQGARAAGPRVQLAPGHQGRLEHRRQLLEGRAAGRVGAHARLPASPRGHVRACEFPQTSRSLQIKKAEATRRR